MHLTHFVRGCVLGVVLPLGMLLCLSFAAKTLGASPLETPSAVVAAERKAPKGSYNLPRGDAATILRQFATFSGTPVLFMMDAVRGEQTNALSGDFSPREAIDQLLAGTSLVANQDEATGGFVVTSRLSPVRHKGVEQDPRDQPKTMIPQTASNKTRAWISRAFLALASVASAQEAGKSPNATAQIVATDEVVQLPAFTIATQGDTSFVGKSALSSTRIATELSEVPQSIQVLNKSFLQAVNPSTMLDILNYVGGGQSGQISWNAGRTNIRGYTGDGDYVDGFAPTSGTPVVSYFIDRLEIIKGPSTIFLAADGSPGGVVNKITKSPLSTPTATIGLQMGQYNTNDLYVDTTGPLLPNNKNLLYRLTVVGTHARGYYDDFYTHRWAVQPMISYSFSDATNFTLKGQFVDAKMGVYNGLPIDQRTLKMFDVPYTRNTEEGSPYNHKEDKYNRVWGIFASRLNDHTALHMTAMWSTDKIDSLDSLVRTYNETARVWFIPAYNGTQSFNRSTQEGIRYSTYRDLQTDVNFNFNIGPTAHNLLVGAELNTGPGEVTTYGGTSNPWNPFIKVAPTVTVNLATPTAHTSTDGHTQRVLALETMKLFQDRLVLTFGVSRNGVYSTAKNELTGAITNAGTVTYKNLTQLGLVYKLMPGLNVFVGSNQNFSANGLGTLNGVVQVLPPKVGQQREIGLKMELLNKKLRANISYFDINQTNNTVPSSPLDPNNPNVLIPGIISRGFDGDLSYEVSKNLYLMGSFSVYKAKSVLGPNTANFVQPGTGTVLRGSIPVDNTAENAVSIYGLYRVTEGRLKDLSVGLGANYLGKRAITDGANQVFFGYIPSRTVTTASITYKYSRSVKYTFSIDNLLDTKYITSVRSQDVIIPGLPINFKAGVDYTF